MAGPTRTRRRIKRAVPIDIRIAVRAWLLATDALERFSADQKTHRKEILDYLSESENVDEKGSTFVRFDDDPVEGRIKSMKRERRVSRRLDPETTEKYLRDHDLFDECTETIVVVSEDKVLAANMTGKISDAELDALYTVSETYALVPQRVKL